MGYVIQRYTIMLNHLHKNNGINKACGTGDIRKPNALRKNGQRRHGLDCKDRRIGEVVSDIVERSELCSIGRE